MRAIAMKGDLAYDELAGGREKKKKPTHQHLLFLPAFFDRPTGRPIDAVDDDGGEMSVKG